MPIPAETDTGAAVQPVCRPSEFAQAFQDVTLALQRLLQSCTSSSESPANDEFCFETTRRLERPSEVLQSLADLLRVVFEANPPGSMLLNSNWDLLTAGVPKSPFRLLALSKTGAPGESLEALLENHVGPALAAHGSAPETCYGAYVAVCLPPDCSATTELACAHRFFRAGFSAATALEAIRAQAATDDEVLAPSAHAGVARDSMLLPNQVRVSVWCFLSAAAALQ